jgi:hypothetical protein
MEIAGLIGVFDQPVFIVLIQGVFTVLSVFINKKFKIGFPKWSDLNIKETYKNFCVFQKTHRLLSIFGLFIILNSLLLAVCIVKFPQNITDSLYNHLSRIGYWIQQGSLQHYSGFGIEGMVYPYNNSLLMSLPIIFLKSDIFAGFVQFISAWACVFSIYIISREIGFKRESSIFAGLMILTYTVTIYESITAQNDLLMAANIAIAFAFLVSYINTPKRSYLFLSLCAIALALGTKQFTALIIPGYLILFLYGTIRNRTFSIKREVTWVGLFTLLFLFLGSYSYLQNLVHFGSPFGPKNFVDDISNVSNIGSLPQRLETNTSRLIAQFISCDGLPPQLATPCMTSKDIVLRPILSKNSESDQFLYGGTFFRLLRPNVYNAETAWYGLISWIILLPSLVYMLVISIKKKKWISLILIFTALSYFFLIQVAKSGWDMYQGRYMAISIVLLQPFTSWIFEQRKLAGKISSGLICLFALLIMVYSTLNNASLPLVSKGMMVRIELWGKEHSTLIQKAAYKVKPYLMADKDAWVMNRIDLMTISNSQMFVPVNFVEKYVPLDGSLGIVSDFNYFPDYLLRGSQVQRSLQRIIDIETDVINSNMDYILTAPENTIQSISGFQLVDQMDGWILFQKR